MRGRMRFFVASWIAAVVGAACAAGEPVRLPVVEGKEALATVNGEPVTLDELKLQIAAFHAGMAHGAAATGTDRPDAAGVLERMIEAKLIVQEARNIGLDEQPELRAAVEAFEKEQRRRLLYDREIAGIQRPDPIRVERLYRRQAARYRVSSVLFEDAARAESLVSDVRAGGDFEALAREAVASGAARPGDREVWLGGAELRPEIEAVVAGLEPGATSGPIRVQGGVTVVRLLESEVPDDPDARRKAEGEALRERRVEALRAFGASLLARHCKIDRRVLDSIDYDAPVPGVAAYRQDPRVVARVKGQEPITVAALTEALERRFFHGADGPSPRARRDARKEEVLDDMLLRRAADVEARRRGLDRSDEFRSSVRGFEDELLFGEFVRKIVDPGIRIDDAALRAYLDAHRSEYAGPERLRLRALAFRGRGEAEEALARLRQGATFEWLRANAEGRLDPKADGRMPEFPEAPVAVSDLPEGARRLLASARAGDERLYEDPSGACFVLQVREVLAPETRSLEAVRGDVEARLRGEERRRAVAEWAARLRAVYEVEEFVDPLRLGRLLIEEAGAAE